MRSVTVMTFCTSSQAVSRVVPDIMKPGDNGDKSRQVRRINNVPEDVSDQAVVSLYDTTIDITWLQGRAPRLEFDFSELGEGRIIAE
jgi:hypothetical protein